MKTLKDNELLAVHGGEYSNAETVAIAGLSSSSAIGLVHFTQKHSYEQILKGALASGAVTAVASLVFITTFGLLSFFTASSDEPTL